MSRTRGGRERSGWVRDESRSDRYTQTQTQSIKRGAPRDTKLTPASKAPKVSDDFNLVTWLVIA